MVDLNKNVLDQLSGELCLKAESSDSLSYLIFLFDLLTEGELPFGRLFLELDSTDKNNTGKLKEIFREVSKRVQFSDSKTTEIEKDSKTNSFAKSVMELILENYNIDLTIGDSEFVKGIYWNRFSGELVLFKSKEGNSKVRSLSTSTDGFDFMSYFPIISYEDRTLFESNRLMKLYEIKESRPVTKKEVMAEPEKFLKFLKSVIIKKLLKDYKEYFEYVTTSEGQSTRLPQFFSKQWEDGFGYPIDLINEDTLFLVFWIGLSPFNGSDSSMFNLESSKLVGDDIYSNTINWDSFLFDQETLKLNLIHHPYKDFIFNQLFDFFNKIKIEKRLVFLWKHLHANFEILPEEIKKQIRNDDFLVSRITKLYLENLEEKLFFEQKEQSGLFKLFLFLQDYDQSIVKKSEKLILEFFEKNRGRIVNSGMNKSVETEVDELINKAGIRIIKAYQSGSEVTYDRVCSKNKFLYSPFDSQLTLLRGKKDSSNDSRLDYLEKELLENNFSTTRQIKEEIEQILVFKSLKLSKRMKEHLNFVLSMPEEIV